MTTRRRSTTLVAGIAVAVLLLAGCGDDDGGDEDGGGDRRRPTVDELLAVVPDEGLDAQGRECLAQAFYDSEVSDAGLQAIVDGGGLGQARGVSQADQDAVQDALGQGIRCSIADQLPSATATEPGATEPGATEPGATEPGATEPGATEPGSTEAPSTTAGG